MTAPDTTAAENDPFEAFNRSAGMGIVENPYPMFALLRAQHEIKHEELGNLSPGSPADVAALRVENGKFGFVDMYGARLNGTQKLVCELTVRNGKVVYDLNGITREPWDKLPRHYKAQGDPRWDGYAGRGRK